MAKAAAKRPQMLVITGLSGSGKTHVLRALEDIGWFCVDNLPTALIPRFAELIRGSVELRRSALVLDIRESAFLKMFPQIYPGLKRRGLRTGLLFLEADERVLQRRFSETRRPHPLAEGEPALEGIREERLAMAPIRKLADLVLDTSQRTVHELRAWVREHYELRQAGSEVVVQVMSFGYKYGLPSDADLVFDVRFLPNPNFVPALKRLTGNDAPVIAYMRRQKQTGPFLKRLRSFLDYLIPLYVREGRSYLTIAIGCTGGRHRSVAIANAVGRSLSGRELVVRVRHRDARL